MPSEILMAHSLPEALAALADRGADAAPLAGGSWIMRAGLRGEKHRRLYVFVGQIAPLSVLEMRDGELHLGACVTHAQIADFLQPHREFRALMQAAVYSANPAVRNIATVGGNLCAADFAAADLVPALLCLEAEVELSTHGRRAERMGLSAFLEMRDRLEPGQLLTRVLVPRRERVSAHVRLPLRKAGDYPVAIVSISYAIESGTPVSPRIAIGSIETLARRWSGLENRLPDSFSDPTDAATEALSELEARDGVEAPGWYRLRVLPTLVRRAIEDIRQAN